MRVRLLLSVLMNEQTRLLNALGIDDPEPMQIIEYEDDGLSPEQRIENWIRETNSLYKLVWRWRFGAKGDLLFESRRLKSLLIHKILELDEERGTYEYVSNQLGFRCDWQTHKDGVNPEGDLLKYHVEKIDENTYTAKRIR
ncbi:MAG: hypothetical protein GWN92_01780 [candidate division Zixibacteria bacterium]|nr:hypothetical protein [candidate division Zixibacteria bacterium]